MNRTNKKPAAAGHAADRPVGIDKLGNLIEACETNPFHCECLSVLMVASRYRLSVHHARIVCHLAGIGGRHE